MSEESDIIYGTNDGKTGLASEKVYSYVCSKK